MTREEVLNEAAKCVCGQREEDYGSPEDSFQLIADLWGTYMCYGITPRDVAIMMILLKVARTKAGNGTNDCWVDIAGYAACGCEVSNEEN